MLQKHTALAAAAAASFLLCAGTADAAPVYLNFLNTTVALGPTMPANPFANQTVAISLANVIDAPSATAPENHVSPTTHVWVSQGTLELVFNFGTEYDLSELHFWNYHSEGFDVDNVAFTFFNAANVNVGSLDITPALGGGGTNPIFAEDYTLSFPSNVQFVNAVLTGTNGEVDFNNIGFTAELSTPTAPEPATVGLLALGLAGLGVMRRRRAR